MTDYSDYLEKEEMQEEYRIPYTALLYMDIDHFNQYLDLFGGRRGKFRLAGERYDFFREKLRIDIREGDIVDIY